MSDIDNLAAAPAANQPVVATPPVMEEPELEMGEADEAESQQESETKTEAPAPAAAETAAPAAPAAPVQSPAIDQLPKLAADCTLQAHVIWYPDGRIAVGVSDGMDAPLIKGYHNLEMNQVAAAITQLRDELMAQFDQRREAAVERLKKAATPPPPPRSVSAKPAQSKPASKPAAASAVTVPAKPAGPPLPSLFDFSSL